MNVSVETTRSVEGVTVERSSDDFDIDQRTYSATDPEYLDWLTGTINPKAAEAICAGAGDTLGVRIAACPDQPELVGLAWNLIAWSA